MHQLLKQGRELIEWDEARFAANMCVTVDRLRALEAGEYDRDPGARRLAQDILIQRGCEIGAGIRGPLDAAVLAKIALSDKDRALLGSCDVAGLGISAPSIDPWRVLRMAGLVQCAAERISADFDGSGMVEYKDTGAYRVRPSRRGKAYLALLREGAIGQEPRVVELAR